MRKHYAWLGVAALTVMFSASNVWAGDPLKPYVVLILDTSGSMTDVTGSGPPSCGGIDNKLNHARCAIDRIVNSYGDMVFALGRFRMTMSGATTQNTFPAGCASGQNECSTDEDRFELLTPLVDGANNYAAQWVDLSGNRCTAPSAFPIPAGEDPEMWAAANATPLEGTLRGSRRYWQAQQSFVNNDTSGGAGSTTIWPAATAGFDPIGTDPLKNAFLPQPSANATTCNSNPTTCNAAVGCTGVNCCCATQCRPYIVIMLTDGDETCGGTPANGAASLLSTPYPINANGTTVAGFKNYRIQTKPIGFGKPPGDAQIEAMAHAGGAPDVAGVNEGYYASDEASLQLAISSILADAIKTETCNNLDDDCDSFIDEDFPGKATSCTNGRQGKCLVNGANVCRTDGTGLACDSGQTACIAHAAGSACNVMNAAGATVTGTCIASPSGLLCNPTAAGTPGDPNNEIPFGCNNIDDDCDGKVDENVPGCNCVPLAETCDGLDNNCNGLVDDGVPPLPCGTGTCQGTRPCVGVVGCNPSPACVGAGCCYGACSAQVPTAEVCDGLDNNCDGNADGFSQACSNMVNGFPALDPKNNPGGDHMPDSGCETEGPAKCICHPGIRTCPLNGAGVFGACLNEQQPKIEICNGLDDDCDGIVDEQPTITCTNDTQCAATPITPTCDNPSGLANMGTCVPPDCSSGGCGAGQLLCVNGVQVCNANPSPMDNTCDGVDDDCDGVVDEDWKCTNPAGPDGIIGTADDCPCVSPTVCNGKESCQNGAVVCEGDPVGQESCNCLDDNCNGQVDEGTLCAAGASCTNCQCAFPCSQSEFPCPMGKTCIGNFCLADPCFNVNCPAVPGDKQVCKPKPGNPNDHVCVSACDPIVITCNAPGTICYLPTGECKPDDCTTFPGKCAANQNCINGTCVTNLCQGVNCPTDQYCVGGNCFGSCADVDCPTGKRCRMGTCEDDPCHHPCPSGQVCHDDTGECVANPCQFVTCPQGQFCDANDNGMCKDDPCVGTTCPNPSDVCKGGTCYDPASFLPDAGVETHVTTGGGGGCDAGGGGAGGSIALGLALVGLVSRRRRRDGGAS